MSVNENLWVSVGKGSTKYLCQLTARYVLKHPRIEKWIPLLFVGTIAKQNKGFETIKHPFKPYGCCSAISVYFQVYTPRFIAFQS